MRCHLRSLILSLSIYILDHVKCSTSVICLYMLQFEVHSAGRAGGGIWQPCTVPACLQLLFGWRWSLNLLELIFSAAAIYIGTLYLKTCVLDATKTPRPQSKSEKQENNNAHWHFHILYSGSKLLVASVTFWHLGFLLLRILDLNTI